MKTSLIVKHDYISVVIRPEPKYRITMTWGRSGEKVTGSGDNLTGLDLRNCMAVMQAMPGRTFLDRAKKLEERGVASATLQDFFF